MTNMQAGGSFRANGEIYTFTHVYPDDHSDLSELYMDFFENAQEFDKDELKKVLQEYYQNETLCVGVFKQGDLVGVGNLQIVKKLHMEAGKPRLLNVGQIDNVIIHKQFRGIGLGKNLINRLCEIAKNNQCVSVTLHCTNYNVNFYTTCGFRHSSNFMRKTL